MAIVYEVHAMYRRTVQVKEYEPATAEVSLKSQLEEGDNVDQVAAEILDKCRNLSASAVRGKELVGQQEAEVVTVEDEPAPKKASGNKSKASNKPKASNKKAEPAKQEEPDVGEDDEDMSFLDTEDPEPEADEDALPDPDEDEEDEEDEGEEEEPGLSVQELQQYITGHISQSNISVPQAKELMAEYGENAGRVLDIPEHLRKDVYDAVRTVVEGNIKKKKKGKGKK